MTADTADTARDNFWAALARDMTGMLGTDTAPPRPMTAQLHDDAPTGPTPVVALCRGLVRRRQG
jgi:hypothetical protein